MEGELGTTNEAPEFDMDAAVSEVGSGLGLGIDDDQTAEQQATETTETTEAVATEQTATTEQPEQTEQQAVTREAPRSWAKESHALWATLPDAAKDQILLREEQIHKGIEGYKEDAGFGRQMKEAVAPYMATIQSQGLDAPKAVVALLNAHHRLSTGTPQEKAGYLANLMKSYGIEMPQASAPGEQQQEQEPAYAKELRERTERLEREHAQREQQQAEQQRNQTMKTVSDFADAVDDKGNKLRPYFDECHTHIVALIKGGFTLQEAYDQAVYANPVTRQKEIARLQKEHEVKLRENARLGALKARQAGSTNVKTRDTGRAPTESKGKLFGAEHDADMKAILDKARTH